MSEVTTTTAAESFTVSAGAVTMTVVPAWGARIVDFRCDDQNILLEASAVAGTQNANNFGATFWPSPQRVWGWPPIAALDHEPYATSTEDGRLVLTSSAGRLLENSSVALTKTIVAVSEKSAIDVTYVMHNVGERSVTLAAWQIARVRAGGLTFFRLGEGGLSSDRLSTVTQGGVVWYRYDAGVVVTQGQKTFADATGWLAHIEGDLVLVQTFPDVPNGAAADGEAEVELYADPSHTYVELEPQGRLQTVESGTSGESWTVRWWLRRLPAGLSATVGNAELVAFVEALIQS